MELHFLTTKEMCFSKDKDWSMVAPSIFTKGEGVSLCPSMFILKDEVLLRFWGVPIRSRVVLVGLMFKELDAKKGFDSKEGLLLGNKDG